MPEYKIIDLTPDNIAQYGVCGYKDIKKHAELRRKIDWFGEYYPRGLRIKAVISSAGICQGMLEYIPGQYAHRPVDADGYMFIHCIFVGFRNEFKGKGCGSALIDECIMESRETGLSGVAVVTRKGSFMAGNDIFTRKGFIRVDSAKPDFELLVLKFNRMASDPRFLDMPVRACPEDLVIMRSPQCPYSVKNVDAIMKTAGKLNIKASIVELTDHLSAQQSPCAFGTFCILYKGRIISHHPISNTRFENIISRML